MKRFIALTVVLTAVIGLTICIAGTERYEAKSVQPIVQPECDWTGWYVGGHVGFGWGDATWTDRTDDTDEPVAWAHPNGVFGGLQLGYNRQVNNWFVLGFEVSGAYSTVEDKPSITDVSDGIETDTYKTENDWTGTVALRAGFTGMNNHALFYGKVGAAITHWDYHFVHDETLEGNNRGPEFDRWTKDELRTVPMFGVGMEYMFNCHWSAKVEYQHLFVGDKTLVGTLVEDFETNEQRTAYKLDLTHDTVQVGFNYHF
jgi:outer membrane immunogenic protein